MGQNNYAILLPLAYILRSDAVYGFDLNLFMCIFMSFIVTSISLAASAPLMPMNLLIKIINYNLFLKIVNKIYLTH
jgi:hypothetical protein